MTDTTAHPRSAPAPGAATGPTGDRPAAPERGGLLPAWFPPGQLIHLIYLGNLAWQPAFNPERQPWEWPVAVALAVAYLPLYVASHHPSRRVQRVALLATVGLATGGVIVNTGASTLFVYAGVTAVWNEGDSARRWLAGLTLLLTATLPFSLVEFPYSLWGSAPGLVFLWLIGLTQIEQVERAREAERLRIDNARVEQLGAAAERERIARDLHDLLGHSLTSLIVHAQLVEGLVATDPAAAGRHAGQLEVDARAALQQLRTSVSGLSELHLADEAETAQRTLSAAGIDVAVTLDGDPGPLAERVMALALRECVTNVVRHAGASRCAIDVVRVDEHWQLRVADDGRGIRGAEEGNGLSGLRDRVAALGGGTRIERPEGSADGTAVIIMVPAT